ncbi:MULTISPECIES: CPBP family glutamic-type intramembrane protease [Streptomyces]|uniref:CPBP family glutamic-type intramembrane protease n=1 Tax=Streptomyces TaxID=1883 RepID=UPI0004CD2CB3|nr:MULTISPECIES: CPBP family glutamic-type intramembrane protease [Streptomyces]
MKKPPGRALFGGAVMAAALGIGTGAGPSLSRAVGFAPGSLPARLVSARLVSAVALPLVLAALRGTGRRPRDAGFGRVGASARSALLGVAVTGTAAALVLGLGTVAGMLRWSAPDLPALAAFLADNTAVALLLEALPEETTLRGCTWSALREGYGAVTAALGTTGVFLLVPGASTVVAAGVARLSGGPHRAIGLVPEGQHPVDYLILLAVFGLTLVAARTAVRDAPLWTSIGTHLTFLTVNRVTYEGDHRHAGWYTTDRTATAPLLVLLSLLLTAAAFVLLGRLNRRRASTGTAPGVRAERHGEEPRPAPTPGGTSLRETPGPQGS